jgi:hypothetical protein
MVKVVVAAVALNVPEGTLGAIQVAPLDTSTPPQLRPEFTPGASVSAEEEAKALVELPLLLVALFK